jgi:hypothetical protein
MDEFYGDLSLFHTNLRKICQEENSSDSEYLLLM